MTARWEPFSTGLAHCVAAIIGLVIIGAVQAQDTSADQESARPGDQLAQIVVTAEKRAEKLIDVPATVQVVSADQLQQQGYDQIAEYAKLLPALNVFNNAGAGFGIISIRDINAGNSAHPLAGIYLDDIPFTPSSPNSNTAALLFDPALADIDHIELLEGPQSTLYGASSMGGILKYVTKQPDLSDLQGSTRVAGSQVDGGGLGYTLQGAVNIPLIPGSLALRATAVYRDDPGFVDNLATGQNNINHDDVKGTRLLIRAKFTDDLETTVSGLYQRIDSAGQNYVYLDQATLRPLNGIAYSSLLDLGQSSEDWTVSDTTIWRSPIATITNIASLVNVTGRPTYDISAYAAYWPSPPGPVPTGYGGIEIGERQSRRASDEIRIASTPGVVEWLAGGWYTDERDPDNQYLLGTDQTGAILPPSSVFYDIYRYHNVSHFKEWAAFGDATYHIFDQLDFTLGARYSANTQSYNYHADGYFAASSGLYGAVQGENSSDASATTYLGTISYKPVNDMSFYFRAASAYRPGGPNLTSSILLTEGASRTFESDKLWNYEVGAKGSLLDGRLAYAVDAFHMKWTDIQLDVQIGNFTVVGNAASARSNGAELSLQAMPVEHLIVTLKGAYIDAILTSAIGGAGNAGLDQAVGGPLPYSPKISGSTSIDYEFPNVGPGVPKAGVTYAYHGGSGTAFSSAGTVVIPAYETLDARASYGWSHYLVTATVINVANRFGLMDAEYASDANNSLAGVLIQPRTFALQLATRF